MDKNKRLTPICIIYVDGERLGPAWEGRFRSIRVVDRLSGISGCAIVFSGGNSGEMDTETFSVGSTISVYMGYKDDIRETFNGEVATFTATLPEAGEASKLVVTAASYLGQLDRNEQSRVFENVSPSRIIQKILSEYGLQADCESFGPVKERLKEEGMTDWKFILELARRYGRNIYCFGKNVYVKRQMTMHKDEHIYEWGKSLIGLDVTMSDMRKATGVQVISHDRMTGESFMGECKLEDVKLKIGGTNDWRSVYAGVVRPGIRTAIDTSVMDRTEAEEVAEALMREMSFDFIKGNGEAEGDAGLKAGAVVTIKYAGLRYDGEYIAEEVEHKLSMREGYTTEFDIRRNMIGDEAVEALGFGGGKKASGPSPAMTTKKKTESEQITVYEEEETEEEHEPLLKEILSAKFCGKDGSETATCSESEPLTLEVAVNASVEEDTEITIRVYCDGDDPRRSTPLETLTGVVRRGKATVQWAHQQWLDEQRLWAERSRATAQRALDNAQSLWERRPRFFFTASSAGCEEVQSECVEICDETAERVEALRYVQDRVIALDAMRPNVGKGIWGETPPEHTFCNHAVFLTIEAVDGNFRQLIGNPELYAVPAPPSMISNLRGAFATSHKNFRYRPSNLWCEILRVQAENSARTGIHEIEPSEAQALANRGYVVIGSWMNRHTGNGNRSPHFATVRPGYDFDATYGPMVANVGLHNLDAVRAGDSRSFGRARLPQTRWYYNQNQEFRLHMQHIRTIYSRSRSQNLHERTNT